MRKMKVPVMAVLLLIAGAVDIKITLAVFPAIEVLEQMQSV